MFDTNDVLKSKAHEESLEILQKQTEIGKKLVDRKPWAQELFGELQEQCPAVEEDALLRLFVGKDEDEVQRITGDALFLEYNIRTRRD